MKTKVLWLILPLFSILISLPIYYWNIYDEIERDLGLFISLYQLIIVIVLALYGMSLTALIAEYRKKLETNQFWGFKVGALSIAMAILIFTLLIWRI